MSSGVTRVAPEEAVFRPALSRHLLPGLNGTTMKMTYKEQLLHPNWQKQRLETLNAAGWKCEHCGANDVTLHVHHKQYIKGRLAWEYPADNFAALCKDCHTSHHDAREMLNKLVAAIPHRKLGDAISLLSGWAGSDIDPDLSIECCQDIYTHNLGFLARTLSEANLNIYDLCNLGLVTESSNKQELVDLGKLWDARLQDDVAEHLKKTDP